MSSNRNLNRHLSSLLVVLVFCTGSSWQATAPQSSTCHLRELDMCATSLLVFTQSPSGLAVSDQEINRQCKHLNESDTCLRNYSKQCMSPVQRELLHFATNSSFAMLEEYCTKGSPLRTGYLKHATCYNKIGKKQTRACLKDFQAALEVLTSAGSADGKRLQLGCCAYRRFGACLGGLIEKKCGAEGLKFIESLIQRVSGRLPETVCRNYKPEGTECRALLPKPGAQAKGTKSSSIVSRIMSAYIGM